jgi:hypothetical protein
MTRFVSVLNGEIEAFLDVELQVICKVIPGVSHHERDYLTCSQLPKEGRIFLALVAGELYRFLVDQPREFEIRNGAKVYHCSAMALAQSSVLASHESEGHFDYDADVSEKAMLQFEKFLNWGDLELVRDDVEELRRIASDFEFEALAHEIKQFTESFEKRSASFDEIQSLVDAAISLQTSLTRLTDETVASFCHGFAKSSWFSSEERIKEFVANVIYVASVRLKMRSVLAEMVHCMNEQLDSKFFIGFLQRRVLLGLERGCGSHDFAYALYRRGLLPLRRIVECILAGRDGPRDLLPGRNCAGE